MLKSSLHHLPEYTSEYRVKSGVIAPLYLSCRKSTVNSNYKKDAKKDTYIYYFMDPSTSGSYTYLTEEEFILRWHDNLEGKSKRIGIKVSYLNSKQEVPINIAYHID